MAFDRYIIGLQNNRLFNTYQLEIILVPLILQKKKKLEPISTHNCEKNILMCKSTSQAIDLYLWLLSTKMSPQRVLKILIEIEIVQIKKYA